MGLALGAVLGVGAMMRGGGGDGDAGDADAPPCAPASLSLARSPWRAATPP